jgi:hypothetical protein
MTTRMPNGFIAHLHQRRHLAVARVVHERVEPLAIGQPRKVLWTHAAAVGPRRRRLAMRQAR